MTWHETYAGAANQDSPLMKKNTGASAGIGFAWTFARSREPVTESQRQAVLRLNRGERELGTDGAALVHDVLVLGLTMDQIGERRAVRTQRWNDYFARRFRECLDRLALDRLPLDVGPVHRRPGRAERRLPHSVLGSATASRAYRHRRDQRLAVVLSPRLVRI